MTDALFAWGLPSLGLVLWLVAIIALLPRVAPTLAGRGPGASGRRRWLKLLVLALFLLGAWVWARLVPLPEPAHDVVVQDLQPWFWGTLALIVFLGLALQLLGRLLRFLDERVRKTEPSFDDVLVASVRRPAQGLVLLAGFVLWMDLVPAPAPLQQRVGMVVEAAVVLVIVLFIDALVAQIIERRRATSRVLATAGTVLRSMARVVLFIIGFLMVLGTMGIDVTPVVASLGVGSLAIGLALQSTLEDFIAGLLIAADQPVSMGDFVEIGDERLAGTIEAIGWRSTRLLTLQRTKVVVPNSTLARATLINRSRPSPVVRFQAEVGVHYDSDLAHVARIVQEVGEGLQAHHDQATRDFTPVVTFYQFGESSIDLRVWLEAVNWVGHFRLRDAFIRELHRRFAEERITIPYPIRTLDLPPELLATLAPRTARAPPRPSCARRTARSDFCQPQRMISRPRMSATV